MLIERYEINNGYGCSCCQNSYGEYEWIDDSKLPSLKEVCAQAKSVKLGGKIQSLYEHEGNLVYGYEGYAYRSGMDVYIVFGGSASENPEHKYCIRSDNGGKQVIEEKDVIQKYNEYLLEIGVVEE